MDPLPTIECFFLDVGQGICNIILLGERRAIVIDGGPSGISTQARSSFVPLQLLTDYVDRIVALVVSHNDSDHHAGALRILEAYKGRIDGVWFLRDRPSQEIGLFAALQQHVRDDALSWHQIHRLEFDGLTSCIYSDSDRNMSLDILAPTMLDNLDAEASGSQNATSGIALLSFGARKLLFPGDATVEEWRSLFARLQAPVECEVVSVPHHGGSISRTSKAGGAVGDFTWLYEVAVTCRYAVVSVGTSNQHGHPDEEHIHAIRRSGATVLCTQLTSKCCDDPEQCRPGVIRPTPPSSSRPNEDLTSGGNSRNVACFGTVIVEVGEHGVSVRRIDEHQRAVDNLSGLSTGHPVCRDNCHRLA